MAKVAGFRFYYVFSDLTRNSTACTDKIRPTSTEMGFDSLPFSGFTVATVVNRLDKNWQTVHLKQSKIQRFVHLKIAHYSHVRYFLVFIYNQ